jgi:hypothetical protein
MDCEQSRSQGEQGSLDIFWNWETKKNIPKHKTKK